MKQESGYEVSKFNATTMAGATSKATVLPWENASDYESLVLSMAEYYQPEGPAEEHLVHELASTMWRKQRIKLAEASLYRKGLANNAYHTHDRDRLLRAALIGKTVVHTSSVSVDKAVTPSEKASLADAAKAYASLNRTLDKVREAESFAEAIEVLPKAQLSDWMESIGEYDESYEGLLEWLTDWVTHYQQDAVAYQYGEELNAQLIGEAFNADKLESIGRYETQLDRKFERTLGMLLKLRELRGAK